MEKEGTKAKVPRTTQTSQWALDVYKSLMTMTGTSQHALRKAVGGKHPLQSARLEAFQPLQASRSRLCCDCTALLL